MIVLKHSKCLGFWKSDQRRWNDDLELHGKIKKDFEDFIVLSDPKLVKMIFSCLNDQRMSWTPCCKQKRILKVLLWEILPKVLNELSISKWKKDDVELQGLSKRGFWGWCCVKINMSKSPGSKGKTNVITPANCQPRWKDKLSIVMETTEVFEDVATV